MKITDKINDMRLSEELGRGAYDGLLTFSKYQPIVKNTKNDTCLKIVYSGETSHSVNNAENGLTDEQFCEAVNELERKAIEKIKRDFNDFRRFNTGGK